MVVGTCCVLSSHVAGFLLIVGVGGVRPHECALLVVGVENTPSKTTSHTNTMRKHRKSGGFWDRKHMVGRAGDRRITLSWTDAVS